MWREGLGCYKIITEDKKGYRNHPAVKEFEDNHFALWVILYLVRNEMLERGYNPKELPEPTKQKNEKWIKPWQTLKEQVEVLKAKGCKCNI